MAILAVISDLDGTLVDSERIYLAATRTVLHPAEMTDEVYGTWVGRGVAPWLAWIEATYGIEGPRFSELMHVAYRTALDADLTPAIDGASVLLERLTAHGLPLAVASQSPHDHIEVSLRTSKLAHHFREIVSVFDVNGVGKPAPDVYLHAAARLAVPPDACLALEDSISGVQSALAAGMRVVQYRGPHFASPPQPGVHAVIESLHDFDLDWLT